MNRDPQGRVLPSLTPEQVTEAERRIQGGESARAVARSLGVPKSTLPRYVAHLQQRSRHLSSEQKEAFRAWWQEGVGVTEIGRRFGIAKSTASDYAKRLGLSARGLPQASRDAMGRSQSKLTKEHAAVAFTRWANGEEIGPLAAAYGVSYECLRRALRRNPAFEATAARRKPNRSPWPARDAELRQKRAEGKDRLLIAREMGLSLQQIKDRLSCIDAPLPTTSEEERARRRKEAQRLRDAARSERRKQERKVRKPAFRTAAPRAPAAPAPANEIPFPPRRPGVAYPPVPRTWARIQELAAAEYRIITGLADLVAWNRARIARGDAPICRSDWKQERAA